MIRWREEKDCYRVTISNPVQAAGALLAGLSLIFNSLLLAILAIEGRRSRVGIGAPAWMLLLVLLGCALTLSIGVVAIDSALRRLREASWVEITVRGGRARWGTKSCDSMKESVKVSYFYRGPSQGVRDGLHARLPDGESCCIVGYWPWFDSRGVDNLVAQMNEYLCVDAEPPTPESDQG